MRAVKGLVKLFVFCSSEGADAYTSAWGGKEGEDWGRGVRDVATAHWGGRMFGNGKLLSRRKNQQNGF